MQNENFHTVNPAHHYLMQPGDGTMYRFSFQRYPETQNDCSYGDAYILESGVGRYGREYVQLSINMPGGCGIACVMLDELDEFPETTHLLGYLDGHGMKDVNLYTLIAVLLALRYLVVDPENIETAGQAMLEAQDVIMQVNTSGGR